jgi:glycosyltransferase involved in cell wall biosynthesis
MICFPIPDITDFLTINPSINSMKALFIGTYKFHKGADLLPKIAHMLHVKTKISKVYVIGHIQHDGSNHCMEIEFFGHVPRKKMLKIVSECSVYVHPARIEAFGASVVEAMAAGLIPVVTSKTGARDLVELLDPDLVVREDVDAISRKIIEVWSWKSEKRAKLSNEAKNIIQELANEKRNSFISSLKAILNKKS